MLTIASAWSAPRQKPGLLLLLVQNTLSDKTLFCSINASSDDSARPIFDHFCKLWHHSHGAVDLVTLLRPSPVGGEFV